MSGPYLMGIDTGTQGCKAVITDLTGNIVCQDYYTHEPMIALQPGWAEQNPEDNWIKFCKAVQGALAKFPYPKTELVAVGLTGQRGTSTMLDQDGNHLRRFVVWLDVRSGTIGQWYKNNEPHLADKAYKVTSVLGWLAQKLTGNFVDCPAFPPQGPGMVNVLLAWPEDSKSYEDYGFPREKMMDLVQPGGLFGTLTKAAAEATGLPEGIPIIASAGDKQQEVLGGGAIQPGEYYVTYGTLSSVCTTHYGSYPASKDGMYYTLGASVPGAYSPETSVRGHWMVTWFKEEFGHAAVEEAFKRGVSPEQILNEEAEKVPPGCQGLMVFPFFDARTWYPQAKGLVLGFYNGHHKRPHVFRAILEGIAYGLRGPMYAMANDIGQPIKKVVIGGGGSKSNIGMQATADIFGVPCIRAHTSETCALGAAMSAAVGTSIFKSYPEVVAQMTRGIATFDPIPANVQLYNEYYEKIFTQIYPSLEKVFTSLNDIAKFQLTEVKV
jgi:xylulokinase